MNETTPIRYGGKNPHSLVLSTRGRFHSPLPFLVPSIFLGNTSGISSVRLPSLILKLVCSQPSLEAISRDSKGSSALWGDISTRATAPKKSVIRICSGGTLLREVDIPGWEKILAGSYVLNCYLMISCQHLNRYQKNDSRIPEDCYVKSCPLSRDIEGRCG